MNNCINIDSRPLLSWQFPSKQRENIREQFQFIGVISVDNYYCSQSQRNQSWWLFMCELCSRNFKRLYNSDPDISGCNDHVVKVQPNAKIIDTKKNWTELKPIFSIFLRHRRTQTTLTQLNRHFNSQNSWFGTRKLVRERWARFKEDAKNSWINSRRSCRCYSRDSFAIQMISFIYFVRSPHCAFIVPSVDVVKSETTNVFVLTLSMRSVVCVTIVGIEL